MQEPIILTVTDSNGCVAVDSLALSNFTGISDKGKEISAQVIHDRTQGILNVVINDFSNENYVVALYNSLGQPVYQKINSEKNFVIPVNNFSRGIYFLTVNTGNKERTFVQKLAIE